LVVLVQPPLVGAPGLSAAELSDLAPNDQLNQLMPF
jgi:hypothetical protein